jgi:drug/metabolite transporter (DMT)-like permease
MLRATLIIFTAMFSVIILKMKLYKHHYLSLMLIIVGLVLVGLSQALDNPDADPDANNKNKDAVGKMIVGIIVLLIGQVLGALNYIFEEKFLADYDDVHPLVIVAWEGIWGLLIVSVMLVMMQFIPCSNKDICSPSGVIEDSYSAVIELGTS